ncbi:hypothetical protein B9G98_04541 [Wickerhamiella sorbophila]|uniref:6-phosphofructo-2-kinase domain-containing protein n=1 Tax=Wickerhamiella sorbophila TaxID=45607 RepID=A0A2T0FPK5_9ASCO|nr:hypothetical protein B9G98_04541 [Wickerhamiella sorbophila]PRT56921.1 hypothetical protein B9G98_04541 [Wickerhamiella sorbophila]
MNDVAPGQVYKTVSGHLYHAGKICLVMVGLPGRGKTNHAVALTRYLRWLGIRAQAFHLANYRRAILSPDEEVSVDYFKRANPSQDHSALRQKVLDACLDDIWAFYRDGGQVVIYDASNPRQEDRARISGLCKEHGVEALFIESLVTNEALLARNINEVPLTSPEYSRMSRNEAMRHFLRILDVRISEYEPLTEKELLYIKIINDGERCVVNNGPLGYLLNRVLLFLLNSRRQQGSFFFARAGTTGVPNEPLRSDNDLSEEGKEYARTLARTLMNYTSSRHFDQLAREVGKTSFARYTDTRSSLMPSRSGSGLSTPALSQPETPTYAPLIVWTSTRSKTIQTSKPFVDAGIPTSHDPLLNQLNAGEAGKYSRAEFKEKTLEAQKDPYHHRYASGESYQDVAIRLEPVIMELERVQGDLLIIAHESVLRVLFGYLMNSSTEDIPSLQFPASEIVEIVAHGHRKSCNRIPIPGASADGGVKITPHQPIKSIV